MKMKKAGRSLVYDMLRLNRETVFGVFAFTLHKLKTISRTDSDSPNIEFVYNPLGVRVAKIKRPRSNNSLDPQDTWTVTYYSYDANGQHATSQIFLENPNEIS